MAKEMVLFEFEKVSRDEIPPSQRGTGFWQNPAVIAFLEELKSLASNETLRMKLDSYRETNINRTILKYRIVRAMQLGLLDDAEYTLVSRKKKDGFYYLYIIKEREEMDN